jgi:hypothetical protein
LLTAQPWLAPTMMDVPSSSNDTDVSFIMLGAIDSAGTDKAKMIVITKLLK